MAAEPEGPARLTDEQIDQLLAPIALYPDSLLAQVLPACTYPLEAVLAAQWLQAHPQPDEAAIDQQNWEPSIKALAHYPTVLQMMSDHADWTQALGAAFTNQQEDVMASVQRLRQKALAAQALESTPEQQVVVEDGAIQILPAGLEVLYVPQYDPAIVYVWRPERYHLLFGRAYRIGRWLDNGCDWRRRWVAVGSGWHHGWSYDDHRWRRDDNVILRTDNRTRITFVSSNTRIRVEAPVTRPWSHNPVKPPPTLPPALAHQVREEHRGWSPPPPTSTPTVHLKPFELPRGEGRLRVVPTLTPPSPPVQPTPSTFGGYQSGTEVRHEVERFQRSHQAPATVTPPVRTYVPPPPPRTYTPPPQPPSPPLPPPSRTYTPPPSAPQPAFQGMTPSSDAKDQSTRGHRSMRR
jgi:hypothetical protein